MRTVERVRKLRTKSDAALLERFVVDNDEAAFEVLVQRHGPMVHGVCRRILVDSHEAEDAFQATFLVLARRAGTIRTPGAIGAWLHAVACQVATRARKARSQRDRVLILTELDIGQTNPAESVDAEWRELRPVLDEELGRLPEKYRAPVVLCYLEDRSNAEAAEQLGWPVGTVKGRLARARSLLQNRLARRGVALGAGLLATAGASRVALAATVPAALATATVQQALLIATGAAPVTAGTTPAVAALYKGGLLAMKVSRIKLFGALLGLLAVCAFSSVFTYSALAGRGAGHGPRFSAAPVVPVKAPVPEDKGKDKDKKAEAASTEPAGVMLEAKLTGAKESYKLDLGGQSAEEFKKMMDDAAKPPRRPGQRFPPSPTVELKLELTNTGKEEIKVQIRGNENKLTGELKGPGVVYSPIVPQNFMPIRKVPDVVTIAPGKSITITDVQTLAIMKPGTGSQAYWTEPGEYTLTVDYNLGVSPAPEKAKDLGNGFGEVKVHSAPIKLKVVEAK
jgi:RNA polymerase sigma factor (sigma-70 family)